MTAPRGAMMVITLSGKPYEVILGSDVRTGGMNLEMNDISSGTPETVLSALYANGTRRITFSAYRSDLPLEAVEWFVGEVRRRLPAAENPGVEAT
jgi:hypothetical protein